MRQLIRVGVAITPQEEISDAALVVNDGVIESGETKRMTYGITDEEACAVGLTCGGTVHLVVERLDW